MISLVLNVLFKLKIISHQAKNDYLKKREFYKDIKRTKSIICSDIVLGKPFYYEPFRSSRNEVFGNSGLIKMLDNDSYNLNCLPKTKDPVILDIGSHIGIWPRVIKSKFPRAKIFSLEPDRDNFRILKINNDFLEGVESYQYGIYSNREVIKMAVSDINSWRSVLSVNSEFFRTELIGDDQFGHDSYDVECLSIDEFILENRIDKLDMIGVTIPGEISSEVISGASQTLENLRPVLSISVYPSEIEEIKNIMSLKNYKKLEANVGNMFTFCPVT